MSPARPALPLRGGCVTGAGSVVPHPLSAAPAVNATSAIAVAPKAIRNALTRPLSWRSMIPPVRIERARRKR